MNLNTHNGAPTDSAISIDFENEQPWQPLPEFRLLDRLVAAKFSIYSSLPDDLLHLAQMDVFHLGEEMLGGVLAPSEDDEVKRLAHLFAWWQPLEGVDVNDEAYYVSQAMKYDPLGLGGVVSEFGPEGDDTVWVSDGGEIGVSEREYYAEVAMRVDRVGLSWKVPEKGRFQSWSEDQYAVPVWTVALIDLPRRGTDVLAKVVDRARKLAEIRGVPAGARVDLLEVADALAAYANPKVGELGMGDPRLVGNA